MRLFICISFCFFLFGMSGCAPSPKSYDKKPLTVLIPKEVPQKELPAIICSVLERIGWTIVSSKDGDIVAKIERGFRHGKVHITYNEEIIIIGNESTVDLKDMNNPSIKPQTVRFTPYGWLMNINNRLSNKFLAVVHNK